MSESSIVLSALGGVVAILGIVTGGIWKVLGSHKQDICKMDKEKVGHAECDALHTGIEHRLDDLKETVQTTARDSKDDRVRLEGKVDRLIRINGGSRREP